MNELREAIAPMWKSILRFSIRRGMVIVAMASMILSAGVAARDWHRAWLRVSTAHRDYSQSCRRYEEGRATCLEVASRSRSLMDAQSEWGGSSKSRRLALGDHVRRLQSVRDQEARIQATELDCHGVGRAMMVEMVVILEVAKSMLATD
jgi:hypothetical protein